MTSAVVWILALAIGAGAVFWSAAIDNPGLHLGLTALVCLGYALLAIWQRHRLIASGAGEAALASATASSMGLVWAWAAASMLLTYVLAHTWNEWWQYVLGAGVIAGLSLAFAGMMSKDAQAGRQDETLLKLARYMTTGQLVGMVIAMIGLVIDDKMPRDPAKPDWAASAVFFFGAAALAVISLHALRTTPAQRA
jgi:hypothetical protein